MKHFEKIKFLSVFAAALVIGVEFSLEMKKQNKLRKVVENDFNAFGIIALITLIIYLWLEYGDDYIEKMVGKKNTYLVTFISLVAGYYIFQISGVIGFIERVV